MDRNDRRRRRDRRAQIGVVLLAVAAGVVAGLLGTHRSWERRPDKPVPTTTSTAGPAQSGLPKAD